jgi:hypothetical protein
MIFQWGSAERLSSGCFFRLAKYGEGHRGLFDEVDIFFVLAGSISADELYKAEAHQGHSLFSRWS